MHMQVNRSPHILSHLPTKNCGQRESENKHLTRPLFPHAQDAGYGYRDGARTWHDPADPSEPAQVLYSHLQIVRPLSGLAVRDDKPPHMHDMGACV